VADAVAYEEVYRRLRTRTAAARETFARPLTYAEKVLSGHVVDLPREPRRGTTDTGFAIDRVALQDALAQIVALQFMTAGLDEVVLPTTIHCDHLVRAKVAARADLDTALDENAEVYNFLRAAAARYGMGFWSPGSGIIHQVVLENYAFPGGMMIGTDSHTPNAGGLGMVAIGVGGGDAIDAMTGRPFTVRWPRLIGVHLTGTLSEWTAPKDVILRVAETLTVSGGTGAIVEYFGPGVASLAATGRATICNMGAEIGATTSLFPFDERTAAYLKATHREHIADAATAAAADLRADAEVEADPARYFDQVVEIDLSALPPMINGPDSPDRAHIVGDVGGWAREHGVPVEISAALIGSCTNSSYEDLSRAASLARQASARGLRARVPLYITPGSEQVRATIERDGVLADLEAVGGVVLANACGPCIGQWERTDAVDERTPNTIVNSFNRNFPRRNDGRNTTKAFVTSPDMVMAYALAGTLDFDPRTDPLTTGDGQEVRLAPPVGTDLPPDGFDRGRAGYAPPPATRPTGDCVVSPTSERLQLLTPFAAWDGNDYVDIPVLVKAVGKCTTDAISAAGPWLRYRGHLERISANLFLGAVNAFTGEIGTGKDPLDGRTRPFPEIAARLADIHVEWCVIADENYGEGSSREHAALEPRYRGGVAVIARSFARIHETNLKRQGLLALTFADPAAYDLIEEGDRISLLDLHTFAPGHPVRAQVRKADGSSVDFTCGHSYTAEQIEWFRAGSALNVVAAAATRPSLTYPCS
jgi:aconitate hydratase